MISTGDLYLQVWQQQLSLNLSPHAASQASGGSAHTGVRLHAPAQKTPARSAHAREARTKDSLQAQLAAGGSPREGRVAPALGGGERHFYAHIEWLPCTSANTSHSKRPALLTSADSLPELLLCTYRYVYRIMSLFIRFMYSTHKF